jgi:hypothetical protein
MIRRYAVVNGKEAIHSWVEHSPSNSPYFDSLASLFPKARFLHLVRDGRAIAASVMPLDWGSNTIEEAAHGWVEDLAYGFLASSPTGCAIGSGDEAGDHAPSSGAVRCVRPGS